jgi:hypothetical protein
MLKTITKPFTTSKQDPFDLASEIASFAKDFEAAIKEHECSVERYASLLENGASDDKIDAAETSVSRAKRALERLKIREAGLRSLADRDASARKEAAFVELFARYKPAVAKVRAAIHAFVDARDELVKIVSDGQQLIGFRFCDYGCYPREDLPLEKQFIDDFESQVERGLAAEARRQPGDWRE